MILKKAIKFFIVIMFWISFNDILAEKVPKYSNVEQG